MRWLDSITASMHMNLSKLGEIVEDRGAWHAVVHGVAKSKTLNNNNNSSKKKKKRSVDQRIEPPWTTTDGWKTL